MQSKSTEKNDGIRLSDMNIKEVENSPLNNMNPDEIPPIPPPKENLPPNSCLIIGEISEIEEIKSYGFSSGRCGKEPCFAKVIIERVVQTGMGLTTNLSAGQEIIIHFPSTLNGIEFGKTKLDPLSQKDRFSGLILLTESKEEWALDGMTHTIMKYSKL